jgi:SAM-dependent methyltransferase
MASSNQNSDPVQAHYEQWVYPEPVSDLSAPHARIVWDGGDPNVLGHAYWPDRPPRRNLHILIAGCGSNAAARYAFHHRDATVVGVDLSESSLAHERHLKNQHQLANLTLHKCRVEEVESLGQSFDLIDSTGVLHHLPEPERGIRALASVLRPDGVIFLLLYGKYGRTGVYLLQQMFRMLGIGQSPADVAFVKQALGVLKSDHTARIYMNHAPDLNFDAGIVDTFLHPQDRAYTVADCLALLDSAGLVLQGWLDNAYYYPEWQMARDHPLFERLSRLPEAQLWQAMELFHGRISTHSFFACHRTRDPASYRIDVERGDFMAMTPIRRLGLVCFTGTDGTVTLERTPLPKITLRDAHAAIFRQVDDRRTIGECFRASGVHAGSEDIAASFCRGMFRDLWRLSYVDLVFPSARAP